MEYYGIVNEIQLLDSRDLYHCLSATVSDMLLTGGEPRRWNKQISTQSQKPKPVEESGASRMT